MIEKLIELGSRIAELEKFVKESAIKAREVAEQLLNDRTRPVPQANNQMGIYQALCVDTIDVWKQNRVRFFCPLYHDPSTPLTGFPWASPISPFGGFDDSGLTWVPPAGSTLAIIFEGGQRAAPYYLGTIWKRSRGTNPSKSWGINIEEYNKIWQGNRGGYLVGPTDESQVLPPWNTENYNGFDIDSIVDFDSNPDAQKRITYPNIYGFKTPEKHMLKMVDGDPKCNKKWKRIEIMSGCGNWIILKDDHLHYAGQWANKACGGAVKPGDTSCVQGVSNPNESEDVTQQQGIISQQPIPPESGAGPQSAPKREMTDCEGQNSSNTIIGGHPNTPVNYIYDPTKYQEQQMGDNPFFKQESECRPYRGPGTPQNNRAALPQSGIQLLSVSGHTFVMDDSVQEPSGIPNWQRGMESFDFGCNNVYQGMTYWKSATGHSIVMSDIEEDSTPELRGENNYIRILSATGNMIELNDHTTGQKDCPGCPPNKAGDKRGITMMTTSNHLFQMCDEGNKQCAPCRQECDKGNKTCGRINKATDAFIKIRTGYGLEMQFQDDHDQQNTQEQYIQIFCPQKDNNKACEHGRGPHIMRFQEKPSGPGQIFLRAGGDYIVMTYDAMMEFVGDPCNPSDKIEFVTRNKLVDVKKDYENFAERHIFIADEVIMLLAGQDCPSPTKGKPKGPCPAPVIVYDEGSKTLKISDRVVASCSPQATEVCVTMLDWDCALGVEP